MTGAGLITIAWVLFVWDKGDRDLSAIEAATALALLLGLVLTIVHQVLHHT